MEIWEWIVIIVLIIITMVIAILGLYQPSSSNEDGDGNGGGGGTNNNNSFYYGSFEIFTRGPAQVHDDNEGGEGSVWELTFPQVNSASTLGNSSDNGVSITSQGTYEVEYLAGFYNEGPNESIVSVGGRLFIGPNETLYEFNDENIQPNLKRIIGYKHSVLSGSSNGSIVTDKYVYTKTNDNEEVVRIQAFADGDGVTTYQDNGWLHVTKID